MIYRLRSCDETVVEVMEQVGGPARMSTAI